MAPFSFLLFSFVVRRVLRPFKRKSLKAILIFFLAMYLSMCSNNTTRKTGLCLLIGSQRWEWQTSRTSVTNTKKRCHNSICVPICQKWLGEYLLKLIKLFNLNQEESCCTRYTALSRASWRMHGDLWSKLYTPKFMRLASSTRVFTQDRSLESHSTYSSRHLRKI